MVAKDWKRVGRKSESYWHSVFWCVNSEFHKYLVILISSVFFSLFSLSNAQFYARDKPNFGRISVENHIFVMHAVWLIMYAICCFWRPYQLLKVLNIYINNSTSPSAILPSFSPSYYPVSSRLFFILPLPYLSHTSRYQSSTQLHYEVQNYPL